jgi:mono/diheme cytochrome c family protein
LLLLLRQIFARYPKATAVGFATIPASDPGGLSIAAVNRMIVGAVDGVRCDKATVGWIKDLDIFDRSTNLRVPGHAPIAVAAPANWPQIRPMRSSEHERTRTPRLTQRDSLRGHTPMRKALIVVGSLLLILVTGGGIFVASRQHLKFDPPYPDVTASTDSAIVARGHYIVRNAAPCASCHGDPAQRAEYTRGADVPLVGGTVFDIPPGQFYPRNITPDPETGLGNVSDRAIARALRFGVGHDGRALLPFMEMQGLADDDLQAVVSYLRTQPPVRNPVPDHRFNVLGKVVKATALSKPVGRRSAAARAARGRSRNRRYLVESVALCWACHTERSQMTGALTGPRFGGGKGLTETDDRAIRGRRQTLRATHDWTSRSTERGSVRRSFSSGRVIPGSPMPWQAFSRLDEDDLRSIYRYLKTVPPVVRDVGPPVVTSASSSGTLKPRGAIVSGQVQRKRHRRTL